MGKIRWLWRSRINRITIIMEDHLVIGEVGIMVLVVLFVVVEYRKGLGVVFVLGV
jgi:hypothetical protein